MGSSNEYQWANIFLQCFLDNVLSGSYPCFMDVVWNTKAHAVRLDMEGPIYSPGRASHRPDYFLVVCSGISKVSSESMHCLMTVVLTLIIDGLSPRVGKKRPSDCWHAFTPQETAPILLSGLKWRRLCGLLSWRARLQKCTGRLLSSRLETANELLSLLALGSLRSGMLVFPFCFRPSQQTTV